jgi:hypothetical protein
MSLLQPGHRTPKLSSTTHRSIINEPARVQATQETRARTHRPIAVDQVRGTIQHVRVADTAALPVALLVNGLKLDVAKVEDSREYLPNLPPQWMNVR